MPEPLTRGAAEAQRSLLARAAPAVLFATLALTVLGDALAVLGLAAGRGWAGCFLALHQPSYWKYAILFTGTLALFVLDLATNRSAEGTDGAGPATGRTWPMLLFLFVALHFLAALGSRVPGSSSSIRTRTWICVRTRSPSTRIRRTDPRRRVRLSTG